MTPHDYGLSYVPYSSWNRPGPRNLRVKTPIDITYNDWDVFLNGELLCSLRLEKKDDLYQSRIWNNIRLLKAFSFVKNKEEAFKMAVVYLENKINDSI